MIDRSLLEKVAEEMNLDRQIKEMAKEPATAAAPSAATTGGPTTPDHHAIPEHALKKILHIMHDNGNGN